MKLTAKKIILRHTIKRDKFQVNLRYVASPNYLFYGMNKKLSAANIPVCLCDMMTNIREIKIQQYGAFD
jgi:hypothetical protein